MLRNLGIAVLTLLGIVTILNLTSSNYSVTPNIVGIFGCIIGLFYLQKTNNYKIIGKCTAIIGVLIIGLTFFLVKNVIHYTTPMWMIMHICTVFFVMGSRWGLATLTAHFTILCAYVMTSMNLNIQKTPEFTTWDIVTFTMEFCICGIGIGYVLFTSLKSIQFVETKVKSQNKTLKKQYDIILEQNNQKEMMLQEIHHRVKNNLQIISSLLRIQERNTGPTEKPFEDSISRVKAMALIHEQFYSTESIEDFKIQKYFSETIKSLLFYYDRNKKYELELNCDDIVLSQENIVPLALIYNEIILGAIKRSAEDKHLFVKIEITEKKPNVLKFCYEDNADWETEKVSKTGGIIVDAMLEQLEATILKKELRTNGAIACAEFAQREERFKTDKLK